MALFFFPFRAPADIKAVSRTDLFDPDGQPRGFVVRGNQCDTGEWVAIIPYERPLSWAALAGFSKEQRERVQLERFMRDYERATGRVLGTDARRGPDPPDFVLRTLGGEVGVELTQLVYADRIQAWAVMRRLKAELLAGRPERTRHLRGNCVYVKITSAGGLLPPGERGVKQLVSALERFRPIENDFQELPAQAPEGLVQTFGDITLTAMPLSGRERGLLARQRGVDILPVFQTDVWESQAWQTLVDRVLAKDRPGARVLIVSAGAPVVGGYSFASDEVAVEAIQVAAETRALSGVQHLDRVLLHTWSDERIIELRPGSVGSRQM